MKLLVAAVTCPAPADNGHRLRTLALLRALAALGHEATLLAVARAEERSDAAALAGLCREVALFPAPPPPPRWAGLGSPRPHAWNRFRQPALAAALERRAQACDAVVFDTLYAAANGERLLAGGVDCILHAHNVEHRLAARFAAVAANPAARAYAWCEAAKLRRWEARAARRCRQIWACSRADAAVFAALAPAVPVRVAPNVVDVAAYAVKPLATAARVLLPGGLDWLPNRDAVDFFLRAVWPALHRARPALELVVAGRRGARALPACWRRSPGVVWRHDPEDMRPEFAAADLCVVPLRIGGGTRLKILEAAASARPTVATTIGAEGLDFVPGKEILIADRPEGIAAAVSDLLADAPRRRALGAAARRRAETAYDLPVLARVLEAALAPLAAPAAARPAP